MNLFVSNIDYTITEDDLNQMFSEYGEVKSVKILIDLESRKSKGYGFVLMADQDGAIAAIQNINTRKINGRPISVQIARPRPEKSDDVKLSKTGRKLRPRKPRND
ncbi:MAG: RNA-binding protein [Bacteroidia bacterium]